METEEECFSGDEIDQFSCPKHQQMYTNYCCTTHSLLCQECLLKCSIKVQNVISIEKALTNIAQQQKLQLAKIQKVIRNYNILNDSIVKEQNCINQLIDTQINGLVQVSQQLIELIQNKFSELSQEVELHKIRLLNDVQDQKIIVDEYKARAIQLEKNISTQQKSSGYEQLRKQREFHTIFNKTLKELEGEYENLSSQPRSIHRQHPVRLNQDFYKVFQNIISTLEKDSELSRIKKYTNVSQRVSPINVSRKAITQHCSPPAVSSRLNLPKSNITQQLIKQQKQQYQLQQQQAPLLNDLSSILDQQESEFSIKIDLNDYFQTKQSIKSNTNDETILSRMDLPMSLNTQFFIIGGKLKGQSQNLIEIVDVQNKTSIQYDFLVSHRYGFEIAYLENTILLIGGKQEGVRTALCESYDPFSKQSKISQLILTKGISGFAQKQIESKLFISGGKTDQGALDSFYYVNLDNYQTKQLAQIPIKCCNHTLVQGNEQNSLYLIHETQSFKYDIKCNQWSKMKQCIYGRKNHCCITMPDGIWIFGGRQGKQHIKYIERYDENEMNWKIMGEFPNPTIKLDAMASDDNQYVYLFGGKNQDNQPTQNVWRYSVLNNQCTIYSQFMKPRYGHRVLALNKQLT